MDAELKAYLDGMVETITSHFDVRMDRLEQRMDRLEQRMGFDRTQPVEPEHAHGRVIR